MMEQQNIMKCIEENSERLDLLQKTLSLEEKQKKRMLDLTIQKEMEIESANQLKLYDGATATSNSILDQEDTIRKQLAESMNQSSTTALTPVVRVLNNVQGNYSFKKKQKKKTISITFFKPSFPIIIQSLK